MTRRDAGAGLRREPKRPASLVPHRGDARGLAVAAAALVVALVLPGLLNTYYVRIITGIFLFGILASAWNLIGGYTGYPDFGGAAFIGIGAYTTGILMVRAHLPFPAALPAGCLLAAASAVAMGALLLRLRGHYFAIATLGFMLVLRQLTANLELTGGGSGMNLPPAGDFKVFYYWMLAGLALAVLAGFALPRTRAGYAIAAIRENQDAAQVLGIEPLPFKILAYAANAFLFAAAGGIYAYWLTFIDPPTVFNIDFTVQAVVMALFGGPGTVLGPAAGAVILKSLDVTLTNVSLFLHNVFFGALVCALVIFAPRGLAELFQARPGSGRAAALRASIREALQENRV
ncbi:MAG TPA: branched-chain amino acid ABC transporter permease [bacterium]|nr:branched-chain amino acid ABC transporter permease [bacterium]